MFTLAHFQMPERPARIASDLLLRVWGGSPGIPRDLRCGLRFVLLSMVVGHVTAANVFADAPFRPAAPTETTTDPQFIAGGGRLDSVWRVNSKHLVTVQ
jgi:hypothetical protein